MPAEVVPPSTVALPGPRLLEIYIVDKLFDACENLQLPPPRPWGPGARLMNPAVFWLLKDSAMKAWPTSSSVLV